LYAIREVDSMKQMNEIEEYYFYENIKNFNFYHGTSTNLPIQKTILPPSQTQVLREDFRKNKHDLVFLTTSKLSALRYAIKAAARFGGKPVVYSVKPDSESLEPTIDNEFICNSARIICEVSNF
jgi:hypothetical protein